MRGNERVIKEDTKQDDVTEPGCNQNTLCNVH